MATPHLERFLDITELQTNPNYVSNLLKTVHSKNITIEEWNTFVLQFESLISRNADAYTGFGAVLKDFEEFRDQYNDKLGRIAAVIGYPNETLSTGFDTIIASLNAAKRFIEDTIVPNIEHIEEELEAVEADVVDLSATVATNGSRISSAENRISENRMNIVGLTAQILGIGKTYIIQTFLEFVDFIDNGLTITNYEDRDGDGLAEAYEITIADLKSGDNILIAETYVPDFWFEVTDHIANAEEYTYNDTTYRLIGTNGNVIYGIFHQLEAKYIIGDVLPVVTADDEGKFLRVINGEWSVAKVLNAEEASF